MISEFSGNQICCGSYAFLNLTNDSFIDIDLFEISTSVPFGVVHRRYPKLDHLLTPICDPNMGLDRAIDAWGYTLQHYTFETGVQAAEFLRNECAAEEKTMIGPIDMGRLYYQPLISLYRHLDHYIVVTKIDDDHVEILDSESIIGEKCNFETLGKIISAKDIPEAAGTIHVRKALRRKAGSISEIVGLSLSLARKNITNSVKSEEEKNAFWRCSQFLQDIPDFQWRVALLYDLSYIMQRKLLHRKLGNYAVFYGYWRQKRLSMLQSVIDEQVRLLGRIFSELKYEGLLSEKRFSSLDRLEEMLLDVLVEN